MSEPQYAEKEIYRVAINAPIDRVWSELIKMEAPRPFFWDGNWDTPNFAPDNPYRIAANDGKAVAVIGRILEMDPPRKLVTTFKLTSLSDPASIVTYLLEEKDGMTEFCLITENVLAGSRSEKSMAAGSKFIVGNFKKYVETGKVSFGAQIQLALFSLLAPMTPKSMSAENWPFEKAE